MKKFEKITFYLFILLFSVSFYSCEKTNAEVILKVDQYQVPVLVAKENNPVLSLTLLPVGEKSAEVREVEINLEGKYGLDNIKMVRLFVSDKMKKPDFNKKFGDDMAPSSKLVFKDHLTVNDTVQLILSLQLKDSADLSNKFTVSCHRILTDRGSVKPDASFIPEKLRLGVALRQYMDDQVHTYRIPGLTTTKNGTLLAIYDVRRESARDLQGSMDIGLNRSTDGGITWEPLQIVLDRGTWGGLPQKFNGISDACVLVDENTNAILVAGLWMHGVLDSNGKWIEGLTENSTNWQHQWSGKGSQPGFDEKQTCQFLITKSTDDGKTWSQPLNLTRMCKKEEWWLWAPAPGHGITLKDGTLVFPTQGRDASGNSFSNITWSKDGGQTWHTSNPASTGTTENMVVQLNDGSIMLNARDGKNKGNLSSTNGRVISITNDLGESWAVHPTSRGALIEPACMASLHKHEYMENGQKKSILLFSNPNSKTDRNNMTIKVSFDDGATWPEEHWILLDEAKGRGYSCLTSVDEQTIGILYEGSQADMVFQKIALSELTSGKE